MHNVMVRGAIDIIDGVGVSGWIYSPDYEEPPVIKAYLFSEVIGETVADLFRADLEEVGFGDGHCGFKIVFKRTIDPSYLNLVSVRPDNVDLTLPLPQSTEFYRDLVDCVVTGFPGCGRNRSVLGGLWIDRHDAPHVLAGRVAVGSTAADLQPMLQGMVASGHILLHNALAPNGVGARDIAAFQTVLEGKADPAALKGALNTIASLLFRENAVRLMRTIFDDHPVAYRIDLIEGEPSFGQTSVIEDLPSPNECLAVYVGNPNGPVRIDVVRDSQDLPEFGPTGLSRWTRAGEAEALKFASDAGRSVDSMELDALDIAIVGAGVMHRVVATPRAPAVRAILVPRRVTPRRFLLNETSWTEAAHVSGGRIRI